MPRIETVAAALGAASGVWLFLGTSLGSIASHHCIGQVPCSEVNLTGALVQAVAVVLVVDSVACFFAPRRIFYASAGLSALLGGLVLVTSDMGTLVVLTLGLLVVDFALSLVAARHEYRVSEQSHPLNLPVFG